MAFLRRFALVLFVLVVPPLLTAALYVAANVMLALTHRVVDPDVPIYAAIIEFVVFSAVAAYEAWTRW